MTFDNPLKLKECSVHCSQRFLCLPSWEGVREDKHTKTCSNSLCTALYSNFDPSHFKNKKMFLWTIFSTFFPNLKKLEDGDSKPPTRKVLSFKKISQKVLFLDNWSFGNFLGQNRYKELCVPAGWLIILCFPALWSFSDFDIKWQNEKCILRNNLVLFSIRAYTHAQP